jgi:drug/metabolite transporter (DMT)-like permease
VTNYLLYLITALIWGSTWLAIHFQLGTVAPCWSVAYRFAIASTLLLGFCKLTKRSLTFNRKEHCAMAVQGLFLFSLNYILYYLGSAYFMSGLVAVTFATIIVMNIINTRIFFKTPLVARVIVGASLGLLGLVVIFGSQISALHGTALPHILLGLTICFAATLSASFGNMVSARNQKLQLPILQSNAFGMAYGTLFVTLIALALGEKPTFDLSPLYIGSLLYLVVFGSIIAFGTYLRLLGRIGPERAAYAFVLLPVIALGLSTEFEGFHWTMKTLIGISLVVLGNVLVLTKKKETPPTNSNLHNTNSLPAE